MKIRNYLSLWATNVTWKICEGYIWSAKQIVRQGFLLYRRWSPFAKTDQHLHQISL
jgi:hypothetical protein